MENTELEEPEDPWDKVNFSDLLFEVDTLSGMQSSWTHGHRRLGYRNLTHNPRITTEMSERMHCAREVDLLDYRFCLTPKGSEHLRRACEEDPLQVFGGMLITYCGLDYSNAEAKTHEMDEHPLNSKSLWKSVWRVGNDHGLTEALKEKLQFSDFAIYAVKLPDWANPDMHDKADKPAWMKNHIAERNQRVFRPFFLKYLKWWFRTKAGLAV
jgi:hypothetical protein